MSILWGPGVVGLVEGHGDEEVLQRAFRMATCNHAHRRFLDLRYPAEQDICMQLRRLPF